ncbi:ComEC/Rec2 family competence protein [Inmirania thermothiophila]|uniref:Beta-lactamase superfamily II metal-dependent hydrolase n=1 Tax=Inmirania thermothiophila TaxID=1750597 RepID=A0A3N1Y1U5_9GAMM|nr:MBL fold metallo-hydrolase [Inmirania thermothiophila]ROR32790.1 beta-lactamase superfamily II metal-dependent hydrolase [Inmirania thermothiophila]
MGVGARLTALVLLAAVLPGAGRAVVELAFLDVGQGDALLVHERGRCAMLVDAGRLAGGPRIARALAERGIARLHRVVITHPHLDHAGGLFHLWGRIGIGGLLDNGGANAAEWVWFDDYRALRARLPYRALAAGDGLACGGVRVQVLWPPRGFAGGVNEASLVLRLQAEGVAALLAGDAPASVEARLLGAGAALRAEVLKVAHHGAGDATTEAFLAAVRPRIALLGVGAGNRFGAPSPAVLARLRTVGARILRTDRDGTIRLELAHGQVRRLP